MLPTHVKQYTDKARPGRDRTGPERARQIVTLAIQARAKAEEQALNREREAADRRERRRAAAKAAAAAALERFDREEAAD